AVVRACLAKQPGDRPVSALELADRYEAALAQDANPAPPGPGANGAASGDNLNGVPPAARAYDPGVIVHHLEAWMPEAVAAYKLRGFVRDVGGEVVESLPGVIRVRLGGKGSVYWVPSGPLSWLGLGRSPIIDMELRLERSHPD